MPYNDTMTGSDWNAKVKSVVNLHAALIREWQDLYDKVEQAYADPDIGNSADATFEDKYNMPPGWAADLRGVAAHGPQFDNFTNNAAVTTADRKFDLDKFR